MKTASQPLKIAIATLAASQVLGLSAFLPIAATDNGASCHAFNLLKKKQDGDGQNPTADKDSDKEAKKEANKEAKKEAKDDAPKEKVKGMSKEEAAEEEALTADYEAYQKELKASLKAIKTPFGSSDAAVPRGDEDALGTISLQDKGPISPIHATHLSLKERLFASKVYMPGRVVIGRPAEFTIKGRPGYYAALAMADKDKGAKPIYGHALRLGPDRKVVALGKIPESGILTLKIFTPVAGDLVGGNFYFEAAVWPENNFNALEIAQPLSSETQQTSTVNSVTISGQGERKHGVKFVPDNSSPYAHVNTPGLSSGRP